MTATYAKHFNNRQTPVNQPIPGRNDMVQNSTGGYTFQVSDFDRLERFCVLGNEGGTYYSSARKLTVENAKNVIECIKKDGLEAVRRIVAISDQGRAPKNDSAIFALALCTVYGDSQTKSAAFSALPEVCRIGTHLFQFAEAVNGLRGWGRGLRNAISHWYTEKGARELAFQATKYQSREGWSHRDLLRLAHPKFENQSHNTIANWIIKGWPSIGSEPHPDDGVLPIWAFEAAKKAVHEQEIVRLINKYHLVRECIPTQWLNSPAVWEALLQDMPVTALIRNLAKMTAIGLIAPLSDAARKVVDYLSDEQKLIKGRVHPLSLLVALKTYSQGHGDKGSLRWSPVQSVVSALDDAFYTAFGAVKPTGKRIMLALDVSGSMHGAQIAKMPITAREAVAAMSLVTAAVEPNHWITGFTNNIQDLAIHPNQRLDNVIRYMDSLSFSSTNISLPMQYALERNIPVDAFVVMTDNELNTGGMHPTQMLRKYREQTGIPAKLVVCATTATNFTVADPNDSGSLDVVGFDTATPNIISDFIGYENTSRKENGEVVKRKRGRPRKQAI